MRLYRDSNNLPAKNATHPAGAATVIERTIKPEYDEFADMTKEELIRELIKSRINEARLKKGYEVKGDGAEKVFLPFDSKNTK